MWKEKKKDQSFARNLDGGPPVCYGKKKEKRKRSVILEHKKKSFESENPTIASAADPTRRPFTGYRQTKRSRQASSQGRYCAELAAVCLC